MLVQSHEGFVNILPALPAEWEKGSLKGFKVRGGATIDMKWDNGTATIITVTQSPDSETTIKNGDEYIRIKGSRTLDLTR